MSEINNDLRSENLNVFFLSSFIFFPSVSVQRPLLLLVHRPWTALEGLWVAQFLSFPP